MVHAFISGVLCFEKARPPESVDGHRVLVVPPSSRDRQCGIVIHRDCGWRVVSEFKGTRYVGALCKHSEFGFVVVGSAHLHPSKDSKLYRDSLSEIGQHLLSGSRRMLPCRRRARADGCER